MMTMVNGVKTIGIVGGGQLGRMLTLAAKPMGFNVIVVEPVENCPASQVGAEQIKADLYDKKALRKLINNSDVVTIETEHLGAEQLKSLSHLSKNIHPNPETIMLIQDKLKQKNYFLSKKVPVAPFLAISDYKSGLEALIKFKKIIIKTRFGGFDGRGNTVIDSKTELSEAFTKYAGQQLYAEKFVEFTKELAVMVAKTADGKISFFPVVETFHKRNICIEVKAPADISDRINKKALSLARKIVSNLAGAGVYGIEMFLNKDGEVLLNEVAPRVHNSGHYTIEGTSVSQFEQHIRAITNLPLGNTNLVYPAAAMVNILGEQNGEVMLLGLDKALLIPGVSVHLYGKSPTKIDRKMGHITAVGDTIDKTLYRARKARKRIQV